MKLLRGPPRTSNTGKVPSVSSQGTLLSVALLSGLLLTSPSSTAAEEQTSFEKRRAETENRKEMLKKLRESATASSNSGATLLDAPPVLADVDGSAKRRAEMSKAVNEARKSYDNAASKAFKASELRPESGEDTDITPFEDSVKSNLSAVKAFGSSFSFSAPPFAEEKPLEEKPKLPVVKAPPPPSPVVKVIPPPPSPAVKVIPPPPSPVVKYSSSDSEY